MSEGFINFPMLQAPNILKMITLIAIIIESL